jgi:hypothetical protein
LKLADSTPLCGSCHGPTYRDWEAGAHGRTGGQWNPQSAGFTRQICVDCHNPHSPKIPGRKPLPPPHLLHPPEFGRDTVPGAPEIGRDAVLGVPNPLWFSNRDSEDAVPTRLQASARTASGRDTVLGVPGLLRGISL